MAKRILLVDDEEDLAAVTEVRLKSAGYEVTVAKTAEDALVFLQKDIPDLILLDLLLPGMQGEEACKRIKADDRLKNIPVILFTASLNNVPEVVRQTGADDFTIKPFVPSELLKKIKKFIG